MNQIHAHVELIRQSNTLVRFIYTYIIGGTRRQYATAVPDNVYQAGLSILTYYV